jgi:ParB/RepB/Spo0J family partition protein
MTQTLRISPFKCRMWSLHDRMTDDADLTATRQLIDSIHQHGQKQPALGRRIALPAASDGCEVELIYGARRLAATRELGIDLVVDLREIDDRAGLIEMDIENRVREDISAYERGMSYRRWLRSGMFATQAELAKALGVSEAQVCRLLRFAELPAVVVSAFASHRCIREDWAGVLAKLCKCPEQSDGIRGRARRLAAMEIKPAPDEIYNHLISDGHRVLARTRIRDEVIKSRAGHPLFRIGVRARAVHLILPRVLVSHELLRRIAEDTRSSLETADSDAAEGTS